MCKFGEVAGIIRNSYENGGNTDLIYEALEGMWAFRGTEGLEQGERVLVEQMMGELIFHLAQWNGVDAVAGKLFLRGVVPDRGEVLRLAAPTYTLKDREQNETLKLPGDFRCLGIFGNISSGKGTVGEIVHKLVGSMHLPLSDRLREIAAAQGEAPPFGREVLRGINDWLKPAYGKQVFVAWTLSRALKLGALYQLPLVTMDGFRSEEEAGWFKAQGGVLIGVTADPEVRFQRLLSRARAGDDFDRDKFVASELIEAEWINPIFKLADYMIENNGTEAELSQQVVGMLQAMGILE